jgi:ribonuclease R
MKKISTGADNGGTDMSQDPFQEREAEKYANPILSREFIIETLNKTRKTRQS